MRGRFGIRPIVGYAVLAALLLLVILAWVLTHGGDVCRAPSVPVRRLDARLDSVGCATLTEDRVIHGVWIDGKDVSLFYPDVTALPEGMVTKADSWLKIDDGLRAAIRSKLPAADSLLSAQFIAISFFGNAYELSRPTRAGLRRVYEVRELRSVHLLRRAFASAAGAKAR